tara:strand:- start:228 stop:530 length:303 start_codon:yes stop_codon:yes gene_type:complete
MFKNYFLIFLLTFIYGCSDHASTILGAGITIASGGSISRTTLTTGASFFIKEKTGKNTLEHAANAKSVIETRRCKVEHSAEINEIFFNSLDQIDCIGENE